MAIFSPQLGTKIHFDNNSYIMFRGDTDHIWKIENCNTMCIYEYTDDQLRDFYANDRLIFVNPNLINNQPGSNQNYLQFTLAQLEQAKIRRAYVMAILNSPNTKSKLIPVIHNIWNTIGKPEVAPSPVTVINWKNKFVKSGILL